MKKVLLSLIAIVALLASCNDYETYGDKKEKERNAIAKFISDSTILVISEEQFVKQGYTTNIERNEFVKLDKSGVYMQIVRPGCGTAIQDGESTNLVCRFSEYNILDMESGMTLTNNATSYIYLPDIISVKRTGSTYTASFTSGLMANSYGATVPPGWLVALDYIKVGRPQSMDEDISKVRLIIPHAQGHSYATSYVTPYYYVITLQREA